MDAQTAGIERNLDIPRGATGSGKRGAKGRKDKDGQEAVINLETMQTRVDELVRLKKIADDSAAAFNDAVKKCAEDSGLLATTVSKYVKARAGDNFDEAKKKAVQLALVFEEVGINS